LRRNFLGASVGKLNEDSVSYREVPCLVVYFDISAVPFLYLSLCLGG
jgi:hypothetical protein